MTKKDTGILKTSDMQSKLKFMINKIIWVYLLRMKNKIFHIYRQSVLRNELEELKIYNIKHKNSYQVLTLKEKYVIKLFLI